MNTETHHAVRGFVPGVILAERYRIIARVGRGGMGEVFRADDLRLGQPVALKFLPPELERDEVALARLLAEVRLARTIAHPNVCRVHDIGDLPATGDTPARTFLSMEYIDGEDLASLLRRIGQLPVSKALDVARQLCAGLAAAHDKGVLHRDLKPANVMIDGRGQARIADFGIAVQASVAADDESAADNAGTLAYMAPERLAGAPATVQSDLYALGLILYETVTGAPPFSGETPLEWMKAHAVSQPSDPSAVVRDIDPAMERAILRCLEKDPAKRPKSAAEVAASLPGGDPLAAAVAAGETPSPEMVAASGDDGVLSRAKAWSWFVVALLSIATSLWLTAPSMLINNTSLPLSTDALERRGGEIAVALGYRAPSADRASRWMTDSTAPSAADSVPRRRIRFQYRQSSAALFAPPPMNVMDVGARSQDDLTMVMDPHGRLRSLDVGGLNAYSDTTGARATNWAPLLNAIGADGAPVPSAKRRWPGAYFGDTRAAWTATVDGVPSDIEAASLRGRPVSLRIRPVNAPDAPVAPPTPAPPVYLQIILALFVAVPFLLAFLARRNLRLGRGDRRGAMRLAVSTFLLLSVYSVSVLHRAVGPIAANTMATVVLAMAIPLVVATVIWIDYLAIEPFVRRHWPRVMVSWARLLEGRWRDGFVGRSVLAGVIVGTVASSLELLVERLPRAQAASPYQYASGWSEPAQIFESIGETLGLTMVFVGVLVLARIVFRRDLAAWGTLFCLTWIITVAAPFSWVGAGFGFAAALLTVGVLRQFGLLAFFVSFLVDFLLSRGAFTLDPSRWHFTAGLIGPAVLVALTVLGFINVLGKQSLFPSEALDG